MLTKVNAGRLTFIRTVALRHRELDHKPFNDMTWTTLLVLIFVLAYPADFKTIAHFSATPRSRSGARQRQIFTGMGEVPESSSDFPVTTLEFTTKRTKIRTYLAELGKVRISAFHYLALPRSTCLSFTVVTTNCAIVLTEISCQDNTIWEPHLQWVV